jgi:hypothetical protein
MVLLTGDIIDHIRLAVAQKQRATWPASSRPLARPCRIDLRLKAKARDLLTKSRLGERRAADIAEADKKDGNVGGHGFGRSQIRAWNSLYATGLRMKQICAPANRLGQYGAIAIIDNGG